MSPEDVPDRFRAMSFNLRIDTEDDGRDAWPRRTEKVASAIRLHAPALVGCQEALAGQLDDLRAELPEYVWVGRGRRERPDEGEHVPIGYRPDRFELRDSGTFWLSGRPDEPGSVGWDAELPRIATWVRFRDRRADADLCLLNTHLDHYGETARRRSAALLVERGDEIRDGRPVIVTGDMNCEPGSAPYRRLAEAFADARERSTHGHHGPSYTFHEFDGDPGRWIDYVFVDGFEVHQHAALADRWDRRYPSDHFPVLAELSLGGGSEAGTGMDA